MKAETPGAGGMVNFNRGRVLDMHPIGQAVYGAVPGSPAPTDVAK